MVYSSNCIIITWIISRYIFIFSISFYNTDVPWITLAIGDFIVKIIISLIMLIPFRLLLNKTIPDEKNYLK